MKPCAAPRRCSCELWFGFPTDGWYRSKTMHDDAALLRRYIEGRDEGAFAELVQRHLPLVYGAALRQLDGAAHRAEEVTQSVFTDLARKADALSRRTELAGWLYTSTHFAAAKLKRTEQRRQWREQKAFTMHDLLSDAAPQVDWQRLRPVLDDAMHELGDGDRDVILQRFFQGRRFAEVGEKLGFSEDAARMRVDRALDKLRALLAKRDITSTSTALATVLANQAVGTVPAGLAASVTGAALSGSAATGVGSLAAALAFMTATKTTVVLGIAAALTATTAIYQSNQARAAATALAAAGQESAATRARLADLETKARAAAQALAEREKIAAQLAAASAAITPKPQAAAATEANEQGEQQKALQGFLTNHPELRALKAEAERATRKATLEPVFRGMGLSPEQIAQALAERALEAARMKAQRNAGLKPAPDYSQFRALFGDAAADQLIEFDKLRWREGGIMQKLSADLYHTDEPFTVQQKARLIAILQNARITEDENIWTEACYDWDRILVEAEPAVSPAQLQVLRARAAQVRINRLFAAANKEAAAGAKP